MQHQPPVQHGAHCTTIVQRKSKSTSPIALRNNIRPRAATVISSKDRYIDPQRCHSTSELFQHTSSFSQSATLPYIQPYSRYTSRQHPHHQHYIRESPSPSPSSLTFSYSVLKTAENIAKAMQYTLHNLPAEIIQKKILPHLSMSDLSHLRCANRFILQTVDEFKHFRVLWHVRDVYKKEKSNRKYRYTNAVSFYVHDTITVTPVPSWCCLGSEAENGMSIYIDTFPHNHDTYLDATGEHASMAALVGAHKMLTRMLTSPCMISADLPQQAAIILLVLRVSVKLGHAACVSAIFKAMVILNPRRPHGIISTQSLLALYEQSLQLGHTHVAETLAGHLNYTDEEQVQDAISFRKDALASKVSTIDYLASLSASDETIKRLLEATLTCACEVGKVEILDHLISNHSSRCSPSIGHLEVAISNDHANIVVRLHQHLQLNSNNYISLLPQLTQRHSLLGQMCRHGAAACLERVRQLCVFGKNAAIVVAKELMQMRTAMYGIALQRTLCFLLRSGLHVFIDPTVFHAVAAAACKFGFESTLTILLAEGMLHHNLLPEVKSSVSCQQHPLSPIMREEVVGSQGVLSSSNKGAPMLSSSHKPMTSSLTSKTIPQIGKTASVCAKNRYATSSNGHANETSTNQTVVSCFLIPYPHLENKSALLTAILKGHTRIVEKLFNFGIFSAQSESSLQLIPRLIHHLANESIHSHQQHSYCRPRRSCQLSTLSLNRNFRLNAIRGKANVFSFLWDSVGMMHFYLTRPHLLGAIIAMACQGELDEVVDLILHDVDSPALADQVLTAAQTWSEDISRFPTGAAAIKYLSQQVRTPQSRKATAICSS
eukprot:gene10194-2352_t